MSLSRTLFAAAFVAFLMFATACSGDDGNGAWKGKTESGTDLTVDLWVPATDPGVAPFEAFRKATGAPEVLYGKVTAKNNGNAPDNGRFITLTGKDGDALGDMQSRQTSSAVRFHVGSPSSSRSPRSSTSSSQLCSRAPAKARPAAQPSHRVKPPFITSPSRQRVNRSSSVYSPASLTS